VAGARPGHLVQLKSRQQHYPSTPGKPLPGGSIDHAIRP